MIFKKKKSDVPVKTVEITAENYQSVVIDSEKAVLIDFWAPWCGPCKVMGPILDELAEELEGKVVIGKVNTEQQQKLAAMFKIRSIPTLVIIDNKEIVEQYTGVVPKPNLNEILQEYLR